MTRLNVVVEGPTEVSFVHEILYPHLVQYGVFVSARPVFTSNKRGAVHRGGVTYYSRIHQDVTLWCKQDPSAHVTTMFDLYALPEDFPRRERARQEGTKFDQVRVLEEGFAASIECRNFIPYLQLHEFEALLFVDIERLANLYPDKANEIQALKQEVATMESPEHINERADYAPSKRIMNAIPAYNKKLAGVITILDIGLPEIRTKCRHFGEWLQRLEQLGTAPSL